MLHKEAQFYQIHQWKKGKLIPIGTITSACISSFILARIVHIMIATPDPDTLEIIS